MSIFQKSVIKTYLSGIDKEKLENVYQIFKKNYSPEKIELIKKLKEEEYQDGFLRDIFVDVLGYTLKPDDNFNLVREFKNQSDGKKADGAILKNDIAKAVIELKSTKTKDLKIITVQAFNYKNNQHDCKYVITSNFQKLRFYLDYANEYEEFDLFHLNKEEFDLLFLILCKESILHDTPEKLKKESIFHEENVSKKLYADYSVFRKKLFENLTINNPNIDTLTLFSKSQKLIDRFLFILFAEDKGLLPPNSISRIIERFNTLKKEDAYKPLYAIYKQYFGYMNTGRKGQSTIDDIPAYNGGLFYPDEVLHNLKIDDEILIDDLQRLSAYDFDTEIDVNILGHIFEHSLSEIEETTARIKGIDIDKTKSKRKKDGIFYTPQYITQYIVENTIGKLCDEKRKELDINEIEVDESFHTKKGELSKKGNILYQKLEDYKDWLLTLKILDPACGSGAFLNQALSFLIKEHNFIIEIQTDLQKGETSLFNVEKAVLENNLYGVDINQESIEITKLSLWLRTAHKDRKLSDLSSNIRCGNSLIDDPEIAGDKAFKWEKEFSKVMENGGFDVVIGNPPYGIIFELDIKKYLEMSYPTFKRNNDLYIAFIHKSIELSKKGGYFSFITPNTYIRGDYFKTLREHLIKKQIIEIVDFGNQSIFADANVFTAIICLQNTKQYSSWLMKSDLTTEKGYVKTDTNNFIAINELFLKLSKLEKFDKYLLVKDIGYNYWSKGRGKKRGQNSIGDRVFYSGKQKNSMDNPYLKGSQIKKYYNSNPQNFLKTTYKELLNEEDTFRFTPEILETKPKIVYRQTSSNLIGTIDYKSYHTDKTVHTIIPRNDHKDSFDLKFILTLFNSKLLNYYYSILTEEAGKVFAQVKTLYIKDLPIIQKNKKYQHPFIAKADIMLTKNRELHELKTDFFNFFKNELTPQNTSKKLENWNRLDWQQFKKEMEKCKVKDLSLKERKEWQDYFIEHKEKADKLKSIIETTDREIDLMVYELYGLTQEEIAIVEGVKQ